MISLPVIAPDLRRHSTAAARRAYVADELRRVQQDGPLPLAALLFGGGDGVADIALDLVRRGYDDAGAEVVPPGYDSRIRLRLREGAVPPDCDAQGRKLPEADRGKVLLVKLQNIQVDKATDREVAERVGRDLYRQARVTHEPHFYRFDDAVAILRKWGVGSVDHPTQARQLVEEVFDEPAAQAPKKKGT